MKQFSMNFLIVILIVAIFYSVIGFFKIQLNDQILIGEIIFGVTISF
jgi:hypothetical protein